MIIDKLAMIVELKKSCVPVLKDNGFKGSFPNFYKNDNAFIYLLNFQFFSSGGSFCINISYADEDRNNIYFRKDTPIKDIRISQTTVHKRLGAKTQGSDHWFSFGPTSYGEIRGELLPPDKIASEINDLIVNYALPWWLEIKSKISSC